MNDENKTELITVKSANLDGVVVIWETNPLHATEDNPSGEVFISGDGVEHKVARTSEIEARFRAGTLVEVGKTVEPMTPEDEATRNQLNARNLQATNATAPDMKRRAEAYQKTLDESEAERKRLEALQQASQNAGSQPTTFGDQRPMQMGTPAPQSGPRVPRKG